jgi:hypothetical protein
LEALPKKGGVVEWKWWASTKFEIFANVHGPLATYESDERAMVRFLKK